MCATTKADLPKTNQLTYKVDAQHLTPLIMDRIVEF
jgi:hypothetical protein